MNDVTRYREAVGSLIYLAVCTRQDLSFVVSKLSQYFTERNKQQWSAVQRVLRYIKDTKSCVTGKVMRTWLYKYIVMQIGPLMPMIDSTSGYCISLTKSGTLVSCVFVCLFVFM